MALCLLPESGSQLLCWVVFPSGFQAKSLYYESDDLGCDPNSNNTIFVTFLPSLGPSFPKDSSHSTYPPNLPCLTQIFTSFLVSPPELQAQTNYLCICPLVVNTLIRPNWTRSQPAPFILIAISHFVAQAKNMEVILDSSLSLIFHIHSLTVDSNAIDSPV